jgi:3',5'-cyclic-AMP phosphodiesterase
MCAGRVFRESSSETARMSAQFILAQISDTHVRADDGGAAAGQLARALQQAKDYQANVILISGDLANDEREDEYAIFAKAIADPPAPIYVLPGNHDHRDRIRAALPNHRYLPASGNLSFVVEDFPVRIVCVDQIVPGETHGLFTEEQAAWLDRTLEQRGEKPTIVALHHPPFPTHDVLFDTIGLRNAELFGSVVRRHPQVARVICGHHHRMAVGQVAHAPVIVAPSTSWVYGLALHQGQDIAPKTSEQPGWMLHAWSPQRGFASVFMGL